MTIKTADQSQEILREHEILINNLREYAPYPLLVINPDTSINYVNSALEQLTGYSAAELIGLKPPFPWFTGSDKTDPLALLKSNWLKGEERSERLARRKNGEIFWILVSAKPIMVNGELKYFLSNWVDITERKKAEEQLSKLNQELRNLTAHLDSVREQERGNISRMVHDELGQALVALKMDVCWLRNSLESTQSRQMDVTDSMLDLIDSAFSKVRWISTVLRPRCLDDLGISDSMKWLVQEFQEMTEIKCRIAVSRNLSLDTQLSTGIYRIFQEALTNIFRHSKATEVHIGLKQKDSQVVLTVTDNGVGIPTEQLSGLKSFGIIGMRERAQSLGGTFAITSGKNKGTSIRAVFPLRMEGQDAKNPRR